MSYVTYSDACYLMKRYNEVRQANKEYRTDDLNKMLDVQVLQEAQDENFRRLVCEVFQEGVRLGAERESEPEQELEDAISEAIDDSLPSVLTDDPLPLTQ